MSTPADKLHAKLEEIAQRASQGMKALDTTIANANATTQSINLRAQAELETAGRTVREATDRRRQAGEATDRRSSGRDAADRRIPGRDAADRRMRAKE